MKLKRMKDPVSFKLRVEKEATRAHGEGVEPALSPEEETPNDASTVDELWSLSASLNRILVA
jgi:hypothetical protein